MKPFLRDMGQWILIRIFGGLAVTVALAVMWFSFALTKGINFLP